MFLVGVEIEYKSTVKKIKKIKKFQQSDRQSFTGFFSRKTKTDSKCKNLIPGQHWNPI
jgi:hypothetical protein